MTRIKTTSYFVVYQTECRCARCWRGVNAGFCLIRAAAADQKPCGACWSLSRAPSRCHAVAIHLFTLRSAPPHRARPRSPLLCRQSRSRGIAPRRTLAQPQLLYPVFEAHTSPRPRVARGPLIVNLTPRARAGRSAISSSKMDDVCMIKCSTVVSE